MKYCKKCKKCYDAETERCPICGDKLIPVNNEEPNEEQSAEELAAIMAATGLLL